MKHKHARRSTEEYQKELTDLSQDQSPISKPHFIFSPENPKYEQKTPMSYEDTLSHLKQKGYNVNPVQGKYDKKPERTFIVSNIKENDLDYLIELASNLGQESSIYSTGKEHKLMYHHGDNKGKYYKGTGTNFFEQEPEDNYTTIGNKHFSHNFDWSTAHEQEQPKPKYRFQSMKKSENVNQPNIVSRKLSSSHLGHGKQLYHHVIKEPNNSTVHHVISYDKTFTPQNPAVTRVTGTVDPNNNFSVKKININEGHDQEKEATRALIGTMFHHNNIHVPNQLANSLNKIKTIKGYGVNPTNTHHQASLGQAYKEVFYPKYYRTFRESLADGQKMEKSARNVGAALGLASLMGYLYQQDAINANKQKANNEQITREMASTTPDYTPEQLDFKRRMMAGGSGVNPQHVFEYLSKNPQAHTKQYGSFDNFYHEFKKDPSQWKDRYFDYAFKEHKGNNPKVIRSMIQGIYHDQNQ